MGHLISCIEKIEGRAFAPFPTRTVGSIEKLVAVKGRIFALAKSGIIYTDDGIGGRCALSGTDSEERGVVALQRLGIITEDERMRHGAAVRRRHATYSVYKDLEAVHDALKKLRIHLTPAQKSMMRKAKRAINGDDLACSWLNTLKIEEVLQEAKNGQG